eukprot:5149654-Amphidinium_carterae.1
MQYADFLGGATLVVLRCSNQVSGLNPAARSSTEGIECTSNSQWESACKACQAHYHKFGSSCGTVRNSQYGYQHIQVLLSSIRHLSGKYINLPSATKRSVYPLDLRW